MSAVKSRGLVHVKLAHLQEIPVTCPLMPETNREYIKRRYRWALIGFVVGCLSLISAPAASISARNIAALEVLGAVVLGGSLLLAARTRCFRCSAVLDNRVIAALVTYSHNPPERCPHCGANFNTPHA